MLSPAETTAIVLVLCGLLALVSAWAGALWWRARSVPLLRTVQLARELSERLRALEVLIERLEQFGAARAAARPPRPHPSGPTARAAPRLDPRQPAAGAGPTLIAVPDLGTAAAPTPVATEELARRFEKIWELAERGATAEAIARATGQPIGQVELVLGLRRRLAGAKGL